MNSDYMVKKDIQQPATGVEPDIDSLLRDLAYMRSVRDTANSALTELLDRVRDSAEYKDLEQQYDNAVFHVADFTDRIKILAMRQFEHNGQKTINAYVKIRETTAVEYDLVLASDWCRVNLPAALKLDAKMFEKYIKEFGPGLPFICMKTAPQSTIAQDLSVLLEDQIPF